MATMAQSTVQAFPSPIFPHPGLSSSTAAALAPGEGFWSITREVTLLYVLCSTFYIGSVLNVALKLYNSASLGVPSCVKHHMLKQKQISLGAVLLSTIAASECCIPFS